MLLHVYMNLKSSRNWEFFEGEILTNALEYISVACERQITSETHQGLKSFFVDIIQWHISLHSSYISMDF